MKLGIVAVTNHIEIEIASHELVEVELGCAPIGSLVVVNHDERFLPDARTIFGPVDARLQQPRESIKAGVVGTAGPWITSIRTAGAGAVPQHAVGNLVANLHHLRQHVLGFESFNRSLRIVIDFLLKLRVVQTGPSGRFELLAGIGPRIGVVKIEEQLGAGGLRPFRQVDGVGQIVHDKVVAQVAGIDEQSQAKPIYAVVGEDVDGVSQYTVVTICGTVIFMDSQRGDICSGHKLGGMCVRSKQAHCRESASDEFHCQSRGASVF